MKYVIEFYNSVNQKWERSCNKVLTVSSPTDTLSIFEFYTLAEAEEEVAAQARYAGFKYRAVPVLPVPSKAQVDPLFDYTLLNQSGVDKVNDIGVLFTALLNSLSDIIPGGPSRERSLMLTKLEEASFYAKKTLRYYEGNRK